MAPEFIKREDGDKRIYKRNVPTRKNVEMPCTKLQRFDVEAGYWCRPAALKKK